MRAAMCNGHWPKRILEEEITRRKGVPGRPIIVPSGGKCFGISMKVLLPFIGRKYQHEVFVVHAVGLAMAKKI